MPDILYYLLIAVVFVTMLSVLVAAHELGHYLFARLFNMGVEEFAIGFGKKPLFTWMRRTYLLPLKPGEDPHAHTGQVVSEGGMLEGGAKVREIEVVDTPNGQALKETTDFTLRPWPLGGFVRIKGMMPEEDASETKVPGGFYSKPPWQRFLVLLAGPAFSVLAGILVLLPVYMFWGWDRAVNEPVLGPVASIGPAGKAGLKEGDRILSIEGQPMRTFYDVLVQVRENPEKPLRFEYQRGDVTGVTTVTPLADKNPTNVVGPDLMLTPDVKKQGKFFAAWKTERKKFTFEEALVEAGRKPIEVVEGIAGIFAKPARFEQQVSGPGTIAKVTGDAVRAGIDKVLWLAAMLSISVGIMNLLPMPPLDGGQIVVALAEMARGGRRLSLRVQSIASTVGSLFVFALMFAAITVDVKRWVEAPKREAAVREQIEKLKQE